MPDREFEEWLADQLPEAPSAEVDERILSAGRDLVAERQRSILRPGLPGFYRAAAAVLLLLGAAWVVSRLDDAGEDGTRRIAAAGRGLFTLSPSARYTADPSLSRLRLEEGVCTAKAVDAPLETAFPGGLLRMERGEGTVEVITERETIVERTNRTWKKGTVAIAITLAVGWGVLEWADRSQEIQAGEQRLLVAEARDDGGWQVEPLEEAEKGPAPLDVQEGEAASGTDEADPALVEKPRFQGRVVDGVTGDPIAGARVGWVSKWVSDPAPRIRVSSPKATIIAGSSPTGFVVGGKPIQLPMEPAEGTELRVEATTDSDGRYELERDNRGTEFLMITAEGYRPWYLGNVTEEVELLASALDPERIILGRVRAASGEPLRGSPDSLTVDVTFALPGLEGWSCRRGIPLDERYGFEISVPDRKEFTFTVEAQSYWGLESTVEPEGLATEVMLELKDHPHLTGRVTDEAGVPLAGVNLMVKSGKPTLFRRNMSHISVTTDADGRYWSNLYGPTIEITVQKDGFAPRDFDEVSADAPFDITLTRAENGSLRGTVTDANGRPLSGVRIQAIRSGIGFIRNHRDTTDARGEFLLDGLQPGSYRVTAEPVVPGAVETKVLLAAEMKGAVHVGVEIDGVMMPSGDTATIELQVPSGARIEGVLRDENGAPDGDTDISLYRPDLLGGDHQLVTMVRTDDAGRFAFHGVPAGSYAVALELRGQYKLVRVSGTETLRVDLGGETSTLRLRLLKDGELLPDVPVALGLLGESSIDSRLDRTDAEGSVVADGLSRGRYLFHARDPETPTALLALFDLTESEAELDFTWPATVLTVKLADPVPLETELSLVLTGIDGISVEDRIPGDYRHMATAVSEDGVTFRFESVSPGTYRVESREEEPSIRREIEVRSADVDITIDNSRR